MGTRANRLFYNLIMVLPLIVMLLLSMLGLGTLEALALEQEARCGYEEHAHTEDCYIGEILICGQKAHSHSQNCYLVLLEDNDINWLLQTMSGTEEKSLEGVIDSALGQALRLNGNLSTGESSDVPLNTQSITALNTTIQENDIQPSVVLNANLNGATTLAAPGKGNVSTLSVGDSPVTNTAAVNFYIRLDGSSYVCIGNVPITDNGNNDYALKTDIAALFNTDEIISNITSAGLETGTGAEDGTQIRYANSAPSGNANANHFSSNGNYVNNNNQRINFGNIKNGSTITPRYATLMIGESSFFGYSTTYTPINFYSVTFNLNYTGGGVHITQYLQSGLSARTPSAPTRAGYRFTGWYTDADCTRAYTFNSEVTARTTLYAGWEKSDITATWKGTSTTAETKEPNSAGTATFTVPEPPSGYIWVDENGNWIKTATVTLSKDTTFLAVPRYYTVTCIDENGASTSVSDIEYSQTFTLPGLPNGYIWSGSNGEAYHPGDAVTVTEDLVFTAANRYTVTYIYADNRTDSLSVDPGSSVTLPNPGSGNIWVDDDGNSYPGGTVVVINKPTNFSARRTITVNYTLNFPRNTGITPEPTVTGNVNQDVVGEGGNLTVRGASPWEVSRKVTGWQGEDMAYYYFAGWEVNTSSGETVLISANTRLTWSQLTAYAGSSGSITLTGRWESDAKNKALFYIRLDSVAKDYAGNVSDNPGSGGYSDILYVTHVGNPMDTKDYITDATPDNSYTADQIIRSLEGQRTEGTWLQSFPEDQVILDAIRSYAEDEELRFVDDRGNVLEIVDPDDLDTDHYAIRWYVYKYSSYPPGWHIDGRLVKKEGTIRVTKTFQGEEALVEAGKEGFYIRAVYDDTTNNSKDRDVILTLDNGSVSATGTERLTPYSVSDDGLSYEWRIEHVGLKQVWNITEYLEKADDVSIYTEWSIYDSSGGQTQTAEYGRIVEVEGVTYAPDEDIDHVLQAGFKNFYLSSDSIAIKKEDGATGQPIGGAAFELYQEIDGNMVQLRFIYDAETGRYSYDSSGDQSRIVTGDTGFSEIIIKDFNYGQGPVYVQEVSAPEGYDEAPIIKLEQSDATKAVSITSIGGKPVDEMTDEEVANAAEYYNEENVLVVKNYSTRSTSVTAQKIWNSPEHTWTDTVTVELYANGVLASNVIPTINPIVNLSRAENYTYTWSGLPLYVNGQTVTWSLKETKVGSETPTVSGVFVNWIESYDPAVETYEDGILVNTRLVVRNDTRRTLLNILKTDRSGSVTVPGAVFELASVSRSLIPDGSYTQSLTTDKNGRLTFDNLTAGYYRLTETSNPIGYIGLDGPVYLYIDASGLVQKAVLTNNTLTTEALSGDVTYESSFTVRVVNTSIGPLPETGGRGSLMYTQSGLVLMLLAAALYLYKIRHRGEVEPS